METAQRDPFWTWSDLLLFAGVGAPAFIAGFVAVRVVMQPFTTNKALLLMIPQFAAQAAMLVPLSLLFRWKYDRPLLPAIQLGARARDLAPSLVNGIALAILVLFTAVVLRTPEMQNPMQDLMADPAAAVWVGVFAVTIGPAFEEIFFRGLLQPVAVRSAGLIGGVLIGAVPFALLHGPQYAWSWRHVLLIALAGSGFGWWKARTQSTGAAALMHAGYNSVLVIGYFIGRTAL